MAFPAIDSMTASAWFEYFDFDAFHISQFQQILSLRWVYSTMCDIIVMSDNISIFGWELIDESNHKRKKNIIKQQ